jgi:hypothetical protein
MRVGCNIRPLMHSAIEHYLLDHELMVPLLYDFLIPEICLMEKILTTGWFYSFNNYLSLNLIRRVRGFFPHCICFFAASGSYEIAATQYK